MSSRSSRLKKGLLVITKLCILQPKYGKTFLYCSGSQQMWSNVRECRLFSFRRKSNLYMKGILTNSTSVAFGINTSSGYSTFRHILVKSWLSTILNFLMSCPTTLVNTNNIFISSSSSQCICDASKVANCWVSTAVWKACRLVHAKLTFPAVGNKSKIFFKISAGSVSRFCYDR